MFSSPLFRASLLLLACLLVGFAIVETVAPPPQAEAADADVVTLRDRLIVVLKPRTDDERAFVEFVVDRVDHGQLPVQVVNAAFNYSRSKKPYPFPYFQRVLPQIAKQAGYPLN